MPSKDTWNRDYGILVDLGAEIGIRIRERDESVTDPKLNTRLSKLLQDYQKRLQALKTLVQRQSREHSVLGSEVSRREVAIEELSAKYEHLRKCYNRGWSTETRYNSTGIGVDGPGGAVGGAMGSADRIRAHQDEIVAKQDEGLEQLSKALRNQQRMGEDMQDEIQEHNVLIDDIHEHTSRTDSKVKHQTLRVREVHAKDSCKCSCALWSAIVILAIIIVVVAAVPFG